MKKTSRKFAAENPTTAMFLKANGKVFFEDYDIETFIGCSSRCPQTSWTSPDYKNITFHVTSLGLSLSLKLIIVIFHLVVAPNSLLEDLFIHTCIVPRILPLGIPK
jgi:hypothetical protein